MKNNRYTPVLVVILALISLLCLSLGVSYSYVTRSRVHANAVIVTGGNLTSSLSLTDAKNPCVVSAVTDEEALAEKKCTADIAVSKNNDYNIFYKINVGYDMASKNSTDESKSMSLVPVEYIRVALYSKSGNTISENPIVGPVSIGDLPVAKVGGAGVGTDNYDTTYFLDYGTFGTGSGSAQYRLVVWIDENTPVEHDDKAVYIGVTTIHEAKITKSYYNISGTVVNSSGTAVSGAKVSFFNDKIVSTTNSSGAYTLSNVPSGTYTMSVTYNGVTYKSAVHIQGGAANAVTKLSDASAAANTSLQAAAYTNYTTTSIIKKKNGYSNTLNIPSSAYTVPGSYKITGIDSLTTQSLSLKLTLNSDSTLGIALA